MASSTISGKASAWPRVIARLMTIRGSARPLSTTATDAAPQDVSIARIRMSTALKAHYRVMSVPAP
jgi:hypothetical protein